MIYLITGLPGSGKSLYTLKTVKDRAEKENRPVFYHGIPELTLNWNLLDNPESWTECPKGSIIVIDECQSTFRPRSAGSTVPKHVSQLEVHRHAGHDLYLITQHPMLIDSNLRRLTNYHYHVERFFGFAKSKIHEFHKIRDNVDKSTKNSIETHFVYPKEVYSWYKSADLHTVKKRIPMRLVLMVLLPIILITVIYYGLQSVKSFDEKPVQPIPNSVTEGIITAPHTTTKEKPELTYIQAHTPEMLDFPHTAPVYKKVVQAEYAPYPAACVTMGKVCKCYTQQGTKLQTSEAVCKQIVENGFFVEWQQNAENNPKRSNKDGVSGQSPDVDAFSVPPNSIGLGSRSSPENSSPS